MIRMAFFADSPIVVKSPTWKYTSSDNPRPVAAISAEDAERHDQQHREWNRPALIQRGKTQDTTTIDSP